MKKERYCSPREVVTRFAQVKRRASAWLEIEKKAGEDFNCEQVQCLSGRSDFGGKTSVFAFSFKICLKINLITSSIFSHLSSRVIFFHLLDNLLLIEIHFVSQN